MSIYLKVKSKHLAEEAKIIRFEERRQIKYKNYNMVNNLCNHRKFNVRNENRATFLARAYINDTPYSVVENKRKPENEYNFIYRVLPRVLSMVQKYHNRKTTKEDIDKWCK